MKRSTVIVSILPVVGLAALVYGFMRSPEQAAYSYLFGFFFVFSVAVGALFLLMIGYASNAAWFVPLRRRCEMVVMTFPVIAIFVVPVLASARNVYPWIHPERLPAFERHPVLEKLSWLDERFFVARGAAYMIIFLVIAELLCAWSAAQDSAHTASEAARRRRQLVTLSIVGLIVSSVTLTFASWDWIMSLEPAWFSDLFGVYVFAGGFLSALGLVGVLCVTGRKSGALPEAVSAEHFHAIGRLELAMVVFWAYMAFCHVLEHWIANLPVEQVWYFSRFSHGWQWEGIALVGTQFALPFFVLLSRAVKRRASTFAAISAWLVLVHCLDVHYLVAPSLHRTPTLHWLDAVAVATLSAATAAFGALRARNVPAVPAKDPLLHKGLAYESAS